MTDASTRKGVRAPQDAQSRFQRRRSARAPPSRALGFGKLLLAEIDEERIARFKAKQVKKGLKAKTVNNQLTVLRKALCRAKEWKRIGAVPVIKWMETDPPTFDFLTRDESERLLAATPREHYALVATALKAGLRHGELLALEWQDIDFHTGKIYERRSVWKGKVTRPKGGKFREVEMSPRLAEALKAHRHLRGKLVFCADDGSTLTRDNVKRVVPTACRRAGLRVLQWHALRHSFASQLTRDGVPLTVVRELLGHATIERTMRYAHLAPSARREAVATLDRPAKSGHQMGTGRARLPALSTGVTGCRGARRGGVARSPRSRGGAAAYPPSWQPTRARTSSEPIARRSQGGP